MAKIKDYRDDVLLALKSDQRPLAWLSRKTGIPYGTLYSALVLKHSHVKPGNLGKINQTLNTAITR